MKILITKPQKEYKLLDSGDGEKLEQYGGYILRRPDPQALWKKNLSEMEWKKANAFFSSKVSEKGGKWIKDKNLPESWPIEIAELKVNISPSAFKHTGLFPEQFLNWAWTREIIEKNKKENKEFSVLNLFGYTGMASLVCAKASAKVTHVDASKSAIRVAKENLNLSGISDTSIRWILDDALSFIKKEIKRGKKYDGIIMDPPAFGRGPNGEVFKIENDFVSLVELSKQILSDKPAFIILNGYASGFSSIAYKNNLEDLVKNFGGEIEAGELAIEEVSGRLLPAGIFARWKA